MPCMCGDTHCRSCGPAQGNNRCEACGAWDDDGGCKDPEACKKRLKEIEAEYARMNTEREGVFDDYTGPNPNGKYPCEEEGGPCGCSKCNPR